MSFGNKSVCMASHCHSMRCLIRLTSVRLASQYSNFLVDDDIVSVAKAATAAGSHVLSVDVEVDDDIDDDEDKPGEAGPAVLSPRDIFEMCERLEKVMYRAC
jgi:hypothetical protein